MWGKILKIFNIRKSPTHQLQTAFRTFGIHAGVAVTEDSSLKVSALYRGIMYISTQIAKLPWEVKDKDSKVVYSDPAHKLISLAPSEETNSLLWRLAMTQNAIIHGNSYSEIERDGAGRPVALHFIPSQDVIPYRTTTGQLWYRITGGSQPVSGKELYLPARDIFHLRNPHTKDGIIGQGVVAYAIHTLGIGIGADRMAASLFENGGMPSGVLTVPGTLSDEAFLRVKESWKEQHSGKKSSGIAVLEEGAMFKETMFQPDVMQFLESRKYTVVEIGRFLGVSPIKLFDTSGATYNNVENANLEVATDTLDFWARNFEMEADIKLLNYSYGGKYTEMDLYSVFRGDMKTRADYFGKMFSVGAITPNEIRVKEGLPGYSKGDEFFVASNNYSPIGRLDEIIDAEIASKMSKAQPDVPERKVVEEDPTEEDTTNEELARAAIKFLEGK